jgi:hypothetical protein
MRLRQPRRLCAGGPAWRGLAEPRLWQWPASRRAGIWRGAAIAVLNRVRVQIQRGHIQALHPKEHSSSLLDSNERDRLRAAYLRQVLSRTS